MLTHWTPPRKFGPLSAGIEPLQSVPSPAPAVSQQRESGRVCDSTAVWHGHGERYNSHYILTCTLRTPHHEHCAVISDFMGTFEVLWYSSADLANADLKLDPHFDKPRPVPATQHGRTDRPYMVPDVPVTSSPYGIYGIAG